MQCEIVCYLSEGSGQRTSRHASERDISEFEKEARTPDPETLSPEERLNTEIYREGITKVTKADIKTGLELGYRIKLLAIGKRVKGLKIFAGIFLLICSFATLYYILIISLVSGVPFSVDMLMSAITGCSIWTYIVSSLNFISAILLFVSAGVTPKRQK